MSFKPRELYHKLVYRLNCDTLFFIMEDILNRLKIRNQPNARLKDGVRVRIQIEDIRQNFDLDRDVLLERVNRQAKRGKVEGEAKTEPEPEPEQEIETQPILQKRAQKIAKKIQIEEMPKESIEEEEPTELEKLPEEAPTEEPTEEPIAPRKTKKARFRIPTNRPKGGPRPSTEEVPYRLRISPYYMANRIRFLESVNRIFEPYVKEFESTEQAISCAKLQQLGKEGADKFELLLHQKMVRDYLNLFTPYRGLLLFHGLGSGKTASAITIAEGMKTQKRVVILTPASLKQNFFNELKRVGDPIYRKNQHWKFVSTVGQPDLVETLANKMSLSMEYITKNKGVWLPEDKGEPNLASLNEDEQKAIDQQLDEMIRSKYLDLNYNGLNRSIMNEITDGFTKNPFDNSVVVIDEAHNLVNRIVNKLSNQSTRSATALAKKVTESTPISLALYEMLMRAKNARIVLLSGTPIINIPSEIAVLYNILRGYITTWTFTVNVETSQKVNETTIRDMLSKEGLTTMDYIEYGQNKIMVTRNPFGFVNNTTGKCMSTSSSNVSDQKGGSGGTEGIGRTKKVNPKVRTRVTKKRTKKTAAKRSWLSWGEPEETTEGGPGFVDETSPVPPPAEPEESQFLPKNEPDQEGHQWGGAGTGPYRGVCLNSMGNISDGEYVQRIKDILNRNGIRVVGKEQITNHKCLPDKQKEFLEMFVEESTGLVKNKDLLTRRILGLTSYFRSAQENLLPRFVQTKDGKNYHVVPVEMSSYQFEKYAQTRKVESDLEKQAQNKKGKKKQGEAAVENVEELYDKFTSTYRIMSRACCNFAWPEPPGRPVLTAKENEEIVEGVETSIVVEGGDDSEYNEEKEEEKQEGGGPKKKKEVEEVEEVKEVEEVETEEKEEQLPKESAPTPAAPALEEDMEEEPDETEAEPKKITVNVQDAFDQIRNDRVLSQDGLAEFSPKFLTILRNILDEKHVGSHLLYSSFRTLEGIGIMKMVLEQNGFQELSIVKNQEGEWDIEGGLSTDKQRFALYTGTEDKEVKEIIRNIYNGAWDMIPPNIARKLEEFDTKGKRNTMGNIIRVFMITASGAEGINLKNTRFVHIVEPYWNMVRVDQVVGRARRICSHEELPPELRTVQVFLYVTTYSDAQKKDRNYNELMAYDLSRLEKNKPITTDEYLYEIAVRKDRISQQVLDTVKSSAIDCVFYNKQNPSVCYGSKVPKIRGDDTISYPSLEQDSQLQVRRVKPRI